MQLQKELCRTSVGAGEGKNNRSWETWQKKKKNNGKGNWGLQLRCSKSTWSSFNNQEKDPHLEKSTWWWYKSKSYCRAVILGYQDSRTASQPQPSKHIRYRYNWRLPQHVVCGRVTFPELSSLLSWICRWAFVYTMRRHSQKYAKRPMV